MKKAIQKGFGFGLTSGIITTLGLMVGLFSSTNNKNVVISGILVIALADSLSDAMGMHIAEEFSKSSQKNVWHSTISTFIFKLLFAMSFLIPMYAFELEKAIIFSVIYGLILISYFSWYMAIKQKIKPSKVVVEHLLLTILVIITTYYVGVLF